MCSRRSLRTKPSVGKAIAFHEKCRYAESALKAVLNGPTKDLYSCVVCLDLIYVL